MVRFWLIAAFMVVAPVAVTEAQSPGAVASIDAAIDEADRQADRRRWNNAEEALQDARATYQALGGEYPLIEARIETAWSDYYRDREHWSDAVAHAILAFELTQEGGGDAEAVGNAAYDLGYAAYRSGANRQAERAFQIAVEQYRTALPVDSSRRWRANGWLELARSAIILYRGDVNEDSQQLNNYRFLNMTAVADPDLAGWLPLDGWSERMSIGIPYTAHVNEIDGFVVLRLQLREDGRPTNLEIMSSYPGDVFDDSVLTGVGNGRADMSVAVPGTAYAVIVTFVQE